MKKVLKYLDKKYKESNFDYFKDLPLNQCTGFIFPDGRLLNLNTNAHYIVMHELKYDLGIKDAEDIVMNELGNIRIRPEGYLGCCGINVEMYRLPTPLQIDVLKTIPPKTKIFFDYWGWPECNYSSHSPNGEGVSKTKFLAEIQKIINFECK